MTRTMLASETGNPVQTANATESGTRQGIPAPHFRCRPKLTLEIVQGESSLRERPVDSQQFFLGSDEDCELQLIHPSIPPVAAVIRVMEDGIWLEACQNLTEMRINARETRQAWLTDGDEIELGPFLLKAHLGLQGTSQALLNPESELSEPKLKAVRWSDEERPASVAAEMTASQLLDHIETDLILVEEDTRRRHEGEDTLLRAIRSRHTAMRIGAESTVIPEEGPTPGKVFLRLRGSEEYATSNDDPRELINHLEHLIGELNSTINRIGDSRPQRDSDLAIEGLLQKLQSISPMSAVTTPRAIA